MIKEIILGKFTTEDLNTTVPPLFSILPIVGGWSRTGDIMYAMSVRGSLSFNLIDIDIFHIAFNENGTFKHRFTIND